MKKLTHLTPLERDISFELDQLDNQWGRRMDDFITDHGFWRSLSFKNFILYCHQKTHPKRSES